MIIFTIENEYVLDENIFKFYRNEFVNRCKRTLPVKNKSNEARQAKSMLDTEIMRQKSYVPRQKNEDLNVTKMDLMDNENEEEDEDDFIQPTPPTQQQQQQQQRQQRQQQQYVSKRSMNEEEEQMYQEWRSKQARFMKN